MRSPRTSGPEQQLLCPGVRRVVWLEPGLCRSEAKGTSRPGKGPCHWGGLACGGRCPL